MTYSPSKKHSDEQVIAKLSVLLEQIDPSCGYSDWFRVLAAIFHETKGSEAGFALADAWSSGGSNYRGTKDVRKQWKYLRLDVARPITMSSLARMARRSTPRSFITSGQCA